MMSDNLFSTHDPTLNAELLRASFFKPNRTWLVAPRGVPYLNWLLVPVQHPRGWTLEAHSPTFGICSDNHIYPSVEAAIEAGPIFVNLWFAQYALMDLAL